MACDISLSLLVLKTHQSSALRQFYEALGVSFVEERHGSGPRHFAGRVGGVVLEIYPLAEGAPVDASLRLGFSVMSLRELVESLRATNIRIVREPESTEHGFRAVVKDPEGRSIELTQS
jgi:lactoylglutathione lyase